ncbi:hypothetical protein VTK73DRAFT_997 [Phialemonium thermophilum]|uniref:Uncharacterized protein n=1 Tax=Phialemonium thermophilum TaxID=223376 RepID=A0ABR3VU09_9PEZI
MWGANLSHAMPNGSETKKCRKEGDRGRTLLVSGPDFGGTSTGSLRHWHTAAPPSVLSGFLGGVMVGPKPSPPPQTPSKEGGSHAARLVSPACSSPERDSTGTLAQFGCVCLDSGTGPLSRAERPAQFWSASFASPTGCGDLTTAVGDYRGQNIPSWLSVGGSPSRNAGRIA